MWALTGNPILCYNLLFLSTFVLSGLGTYLFVRELTGNPRAAFVAGLLVRVRAVPVSAELAPAGAVVAVDAVRALRLPAVLRLHRHGRFGRGAAGGRCWAQRRRWSRRTCRAATTCVLLAVRRGLRPVGDRRRRLWRHRRTLAATRSQRRRRLRADAYRSCCRTSRCRSSCRSRAAEASCRCTAADVYSYSTAVREQLVWGDMPRRLSQSRGQISSRVSWPSSSPSSASPPGDATHAAIGAAAGEQDGLGAACVSATLHLLAAAATSSIGE